MFLGEDLLPWLTVALGAALVCGHVLAFFRPPENPNTGDLSRPPMVRSIIMIVIGLISSIWGLASLLS